LNFKDSLDYNPLSIKNIMNELDRIDSLQWTPAAKAKLKNIPFFVRPQARQKIEELARSTNCDEITPEIVERARAELGQ
jgi:hypothetical protein